MPTRVSAEALANNPLFAGLKAADLDSLLASFEEVSCPADGVLFRTGELGPALYLLLDGAVEIVLDVPAGMEKIIATLESNSVFGESTFFHPAPHSATGRAVVASRLLKLSRREYERLLDAGSYPACRLGTNAADTLAARLQATDRWVAQLLGQEQEQVAASWRRFRESVGSSFDLPHGFIHPY
ncbi:MAG TPA: cyclic nucleotide-binding domain-containing protein [Pirellulales bacterium]|nr:cyclic nucleotide-binding domain-containing protein [Pirellulales bacterium]